MLAADRVWTAPPGHGGAPPVRDWKLAIDRGDWGAVTGPNGGGKTTLALTLAGLWPARSGTVTLDGHPFGPGAPPELRARVAVVLQDPGHQILQRPVLDELAFGART